MLQIMKIAYDGVLDLKWENRTMDEAFCTLPLGCKQMNNVCSNTEKLCDFFLESQKSR
jgi:hypothetical protein